MKLINFFAVLFFVSFFFCSCKKSDDMPAPTPAPKADTLSAGWELVDLDPTLSNVNGGADIFFTSNTDGYVATSNYIYKSTNGGSTWNKILNFGSINIAAINSSNAFFVSTSSIYKTTDGGATTTSTTLPTSTIHDIFFADTNTGLCSTADGLFKTANGGNTWTNTSAYSGAAGATYTSVFMFGNNNAWVVYNNKIVHANGSLNTWQTDSITTTIPSLGLVGLFATSASVVYASSYTGYFFKSVNGGSSFTQVKKLDNVQIDFQSSFSDLHFTDANTGYMSLGSRIYKTTDAGNNWSVVVALGTTNIIEIHFTDSFHGWAICNNGKVLKFN